MTYDKTDPDDDGVVEADVDNESVNTDELSTIYSHRVQSTSELENIDNDISQGDVVGVAQPDTPYRTTSWIDVDTQDVKIVFESPFAKDGQAIVKPADGADVGGIRIGTGATTVTDVHVENFGFDGNQSTMTDTVKRLHGVIVDNAESVDVKYGYFTQTHPYQEHNTGGSGISVRDAATDVTIEGNRIDDIGDRGIQCGGQELNIINNHAINGYDRGVSLDIVQPDGNRYYARVANVEGNIIGDNSDGSAIGAGGDSTQRADRGYWNISNNVFYGSHRNGVKVLASIASVSITGNVGENTASVSETNGTQYGVAAYGNQRFTVSGNVLTGYDDGGVHIGSNHVTVSSNVIRDSDGQGIVSDLSSSFATIVGNTVRDCSVGVDLADGTNKSVVVGNTIFGSQFDSVKERFDAGVNNNLIAANWGESALSLEGANTVAFGNKPGVDVHRNLAPSSGSVTVTLDKPYSEKPTLNISTESPALVGVTYTDTDSDGNYEEVTVSFEGSGGAAINPTTHMTVAR